MKKTMLSTALLTLMMTTPYAAQTPAGATPPTAQPVAATPSTTAAAVVNCDYHIPANTGPLDQSLVMDWAGKAAVQSFDFSPTQIDDQLKKLKTCFTDQGWQGFNDALQQSGNINAIKNQNLSVSSQVDGDVKFNPVKDNQWKVSVPLQVVYQNDKEKLTQSLAVELLIGRKVSGDLGIMQIIATPRVASANAAPGAGASPTSAVDADKTTH